MSSKPKPDFQSIPVKIVPVEKELPIALFVFVAGKFIRYRHKGGILEAETRDRLSQKGLKEFYSNESAQTLDAVLDYTGVRTAKNSTDGDALSYDKQPPPPSHEDVAATETMTAPDETAENTQIQGQPHEVSSAVIVSGDASTQAESEAAKFLQAERDREMLMANPDYDAKDALKKANAFITKLVAMEKSKPNDISVKVALAKAYLEGNRVEDALGLFKTLKKKFAHSPAGFVGLIETYIQRKWIAKAAAEFDEFSAQFPDDPATARLKIILDRKIEEENQEKSRAREEAARKQKDQASQAKQKLDQIFKK